MKEKTAFDFMLNNGIKIMTHDDRLLVRAQKSEIGIAENYRENAPFKTINGLREIAGYILFDINGEIIKNLPPSEAEQAEILGYIPHYKRGGKIAEGVTYELFFNQLDIRLCNLYDNAQTRYRNALENISILCEMGVISYKPKITKPNRRNMREAVRHRLKQYAKPTEYEHNILLEGEIGRALYYDIINSGQAQNIEGTLYIGGFRRYEGQKSAYKVYDIGRREGVALGRYFKAEITLLKNYFKHPGGQQGRITIDELLTQPEIQETIKEKLIRDYTKILKLATPETLKMICAELGITAQNSREIYKNAVLGILDTKRTYLKAIEAQRQERKELEKALREVERKERRIVAQTKRKEYEAELAEIKREKAGIQAEYERKIQEADSGKEWEN